MRPTKSCTSTISLVPTAYIAYRPSATILLVSPKRKLFPRARRLSDRPLSCIFTISLVSTEHIAYRFPAAVILVSPEPVDSPPTDHSPVPPPNPEPSLANPVESVPKSESEDFLDKLFKDKVKHHVSGPGVVDSA